MKKIAYILISGIALFLTGCNHQPKKVQSIEKSEALILSQEEQITPAQLQDVFDNQWNHFVDTQHEDAMLWHGLTVGQIRQDLLANELLIPIEGARYGVCPRFSETSIYVSNYTVLAYASDGHWEEQLFLSYEVEAGNITWTVLAYTHGGEVHLMKD